MTSVANISSATLVKEDIRTVSIKVTATLDLSKPACLSRQKINKIRARSVNSYVKIPCRNINICAAVECFQL